jgi:MFS family permease
MVEVKGNKINERTNRMAKISMKHYTTALLSITVFFLFADQNLLAPNLSVIAKEFGFDSHERDEKLGGYIAFGFFIVGGPVALLVGYFTDFFNRCMLFGIVVVMGASASLSTYWVKTYPQLLACRIFTGIGIGGVNPIIFSLLGDLYPGSSRIYVSTMIGLSQSAGVAAGQFIAGMAGPSIGWRAPFLMVAVPALISAVLVFFTVDEPDRGGQEKAVQIFKESKTIVTTNYIKTNHTHQVNSDSEKGKNSLSHSFRSNFTFDETLIFEERKEEHERETEHYNKDKGLENVVGNSCSIYTKSQTIRSHGEEACLSDNLGNDTITVTSQAFELKYKEEQRECQAQIIEENAVEYKEKIECKKVMNIFQTPSAVLIFVQGFPGCLPWGVIIVFLNDYFSEERGMTIQQATAALTCFGLGGLLGQLFGGWSGQKLYNYDPRYQTVLMGVSTLLSVIPILYLLNTSHTRDAGFFFMAWFGGFLVNINGPNVRVVLQVTQSHD